MSVSASLPVDSATAVHRLILPIPLLYALSSTDG